MNIINKNKGQSGLRNQLMSVMSVTAVLIILTVTISIVLGFRELFDKSFDSVSDGADKTTADLMEEYYFTYSRELFDRSVTLSSVLNVELDDYEFNREPEWETFLADIIERFSFSDDGGYFLYVENRLYTFGLSEDICKKILNDFYNNPNLKSEAIFNDKNVFSWISTNESGFAYIPESSAPCAAFHTFGMEHFKNKNCKCGVIVINNSADFIAQNVDYSRAMNEDVILKNIFMVLRKILLILLISMICILAVFFIIIRHLSKSIATPVEMRELMQEIEIEKAENEKEMLVELNRLKTEFLSNVSHELKTPLAVISGYAQIAESRLTSDYTHEDIINDLRRISSEANLLATMISKVLDATRIEENRVELNLAKCWLDETVSEVASEYFAVLNDRENKLRISISPDIPPVLADREYLKRIFLNLISNSLKYTDHGTIKITAEESDDGFAVITVSDTGSGIDPEILPNLFERYYKAHNSKKGTGLGLYICKNIVEQHGGTIHAESEPGHGTKFIFTIPFAPDGNSEEEIIE